MNCLKVSVAVVAVLITGYSVTAQEAKTSRAQATTLSAKAVAPRVELLPKEFCEEKTIRQARSSRNMIQVSCETLPIPSRLTASSARPDARAKITGHCKEVNGSIECDWACAADEKSHCQNFITNCVGEGGTVEGNKDSATCKP